MDTQTGAALRRGVADSLRCGDWQGWLDGSGVYADYLDESGECQRAERRRLKVLRARSPGCLWPRASSLRGVTDHQREQLRRALSRPVGLLLGTPGTGKTHCLAAVMRAILRVPTNTVAVCAPTGKAAVRVRSSIEYALGGHWPTSTIHHLLEIGRNGHDGAGWGFQRNADRPLPYRFVLVDEPSMLDVDLFSHLLDACRPGTHILLVGDPYQLPPVGHGAPLRDLRDSGTVPAGELTEVHRNGGLIVEACARIRQGKSFEAVSLNDAQPGVPDRNLAHVECPTPAEQLGVLGVVLDRLGREWDIHPAWDTQVIAAVNRGSQLARATLNRALQQRLNPDGPGNGVWRVGDKVICTRNSFHPDSDTRGNHYIANGEIGQVTRIERAVAHVLLPHPERQVMVFMPRGREANSDEGGAESGRESDWDLAYAITGHKSQGSEWPAVVVMLDGSPGARRVCSREWLYTAMSRGSRIVITIGQRRVMDSMVGRPALDRRKTFLREMLNG